MFVDISNVVAKLLCGNSINIFHTSLVTFENRPFYSCVFSSVTRPMDNSEAGADLVLTKTSLFWGVNQSFIMLTSWHLHEKSREACIKARSPPASLTVIGQVTKH